MPPPPPSSLSFTPTTVQTVPVIGEKFTVSKKPVVSDMVIEKRWVTKNEIIEVPITYEEIYVNGKPMAADSSGFLSSVKKALGGSSKSETTTTNYYDSKSKDARSEGEFVPISSTETEKVIPLYGEQITISKKMVRLNDVVIKKKRKTETRKMKVDVRKEIVKARHPDGRIEQLSS
jgi:stress response protein YsnF